MPEEDYLELQASESEDIYDSGGETDFGRKTASSLREKGKKIIKDWVDWVETRENEYIFHLSVG